jgi:outer membrane lipoprotein-sorting protein
MGGCSEHVANWQSELPNLSEKSLSMNASPDWQLEDQLRQALGSPPQADFDRWRARHVDAVAYLNPIVTDNYRRRRRMIVRIASASVAAVGLVSFLSLFVSDRVSFAQVAQAIDKAHTITWRSTFYVRVYSEDGKRTWLREEPTETAYRSPNLYRDTRYDMEGKVSSVEIVDVLTNKALRLNMKARTATWLAEPTNQYSPEGPFNATARVLENEPIELVGQKEINGVKVSVFRWHRENSPLVNPTNSFDHRKSVDIWLNAKTKELVRVYDPGADCFDPDTDADRNKPAEERVSKGRMMGLMKSDIVFDADLNHELFSLTPPEGFKIIVQPPKPTVTEAEMIEWLGAAARFNGGTFFDNFRGFDLERYNKEVATKDKADRTDVGQKLFDLEYKHLLNRNSPVMPSFANEFTVGGRFRYLGKGVRLGSADRIVLFYKLKSTGTYRAVYGDLTVKDISPKDLPLPFDQ